MTIKEAAKQLHVETHVLRYWEDELQLDIKRNAQGHRYYDERDIRLFESVKAMKEEGLTLKDIRNAIIRAKRAVQGKADAVTETEDSAGKEAMPVAELQPVHTRIDEDKDSMLERMEKAVAENDPKVVDFKQAQLKSVMNRVIATALREYKDIITSSI